MFVPYCADAACSGKITYELRKKTLPSIPLVAATNAPKDAREATAERSSYPHGSRTPSDGPRGGSDLFTSGLLAVKERNASSHPGGDIERDVRVIFDRAEKVRTFFLNLQSDVTMLIPPIPFWLHRK